jgi:hypothetical protein
VLSTIQTGLYALHFLSKPVYILYALITNRTRGLRFRITSMRIRIHSFTLKRIRIQIFTFMQILIQIMLLIKVMRILDRHSLQAHQCSILSFHASIVSLWSSQILTLMRIHADSDPQPCLIQYLYVNCTICDSSLISRALAVFTVSSAPFTLPI